jgi:hypothetical protein
MDVRGSATGGNAGLSARFSAVLVVAWTCLVWLNYFHYTPVDAGKLGRALTAYATINPLAALRVLPGHLWLLFTVALLALGARGAGMGAADFIGAGRGIRRELSSLALGGGIIGLALLGAGLAGLVFRSLAWVGILVAAYAGRKGLKVPQVRPLFAGGAWPFTLALAVGLWTALVGCLAPEGAFDALGHHMLHPAMFIEAHKIHGIPWHFLSNNPALLEMQYMGAMLLSGSLQSAKLVHLAWGLLVAASVYHWSREGLEPRWAMAAAAAFILLPYVQLLLMWAYVDFGTAGYLILACWAAASRPRKYVLAGILAGLCAGTKIPGVFAAVLVMAVLAAVRAPRRAWLWAGGACIIAALPWGAKNLLFSGNPVAPLFPGHIKTLWWDADNYARYNAELRSYEPRLGPALGGLFALPWKTSILNHGVLDEGGGMGGWFLWGLPLLLLLPVSGPARIPALLALGYFILWLFVPRQTRYLLPAWPLACITVAHSARALAKSVPLNRAVAWSAAGILGLLALAAIQRQHFLINPLPYVFGAENAEEYLARGLPGKPDSVRAAHWLGENPVRGKLLMLAEFRNGIYWGNRLVFQSVFDTAVYERFARESADSNRIGVRLRQMGIVRGLYPQLGGSRMADAYGTFNFSGQAGRRWRGWWERAAWLEHSEEERYLVFGMRGSPALPPLVPARSVLPGLDEQWLARIDTAPPEDPAQAAAAYRKIAVDTGSPAAWERAGVSFIKAGQPGAALAALRTAERGGRRTAMLYDAIGYLDSQAGRAESAASSFRKALALRPGLAEARTNLVSVLMELGQTAEALQFLREGMAIDPGNAEFYALWTRYTGGAPPAP